MALKAKWIDLLYNVATGSRRTRNLFTPLGAIFFGLLLFVFVLVSLKLDRLLGITDIFPVRFNLILSLPFFTVAVFLMGWSVQHFLKVKGTPVPFNPPPRLVTSGPYAYTRNPMLTGVFGLLFGSGILLESVSLLLVFTPLFIYVNYWELKAIEEPELVKRLGQEYIQYRKVTPMFFPRFKSSKYKEKDHEHRSPPKI
jgi:protein-S-isoprenylcysteine O-methyltransferase Ste14